MHITIHCKYQSSDMLINIHCKYQCSDIEYSLDIHFTSNVESRNSNMQKFHTSFINVYRNELRNCVPPIRVSFLKTFQPHSANGASTERGLVEINYCIFVYLLKPNGMELIDVA